MWYTILMQIYFVFTLFDRVCLPGARFSSADAQSQLPAWIRPACQSYPTFGRAIRDMMLFFRKCQQLVSLLYHQRCIKGVLKMY